MPRFSGRLGMPYKLPKPQRSDGEKAQPPSHMTERRPDGETAQPSPPQPRP